LLYRYGFIIIFFVRSLSVFFLAAIFSSAARAANLELRSERLNIHSARLEVLDIRYLSLLECLVYRQDFDAFAHPCRCTYLSVFDIIGDELL